MDVIGDAALFQKNKGRESTWVAGGHPQCHLQEGTTMSSPREGTTEGALVVLLSSASASVWTVRWRHQRLPLLLDGMYAFQPSEAWFWHQFMF